MPIGGMRSLIQLTPKEEIPNLHFLVPVPELLLTGF